MDKIFISGCGDIGKRVVGCCRQSHPQARYYGLVRQPDQGQQLTSLGIIPVVYDFDHAPPIKLPTYDATLFHFMPPPTSGVTDPRFRALLTACENHGLPRKLILLSTTAVYGDCQGAWIDETAEINPQTERGRRRWDAEQVLQQWATRNNIPYVILRVAGIYGAGRYPIDKLTRGMEILREDQSPFSNRIHQDDLASICVAAAQYGSNGAVYNVSDGHPTTMAHYFKAVAKKFGLPPPTEIDMQQAQQQLSSGMLSYLNESRRISNLKLLSELHVSLLYPDLNAGLNAS